MKTIILTSNISIIGNYFESWLAFLDLHDRARIANKEAAGSCSFLYIKFAVKYLDDYIYFTVPLKIFSPFPVVYLIIKQ